MKTPARKTRQSGDPASFSPSASLATKPPAQVTLVPAPADDPKTRETIVHLLTKLLDR